MEQAAVFGTQERVEWHLENWADWMKSGKAVSGYPQRACGCTSWGDGWDDETVIDNAARASAKAIHAIIEGLLDIEKLALNHAYLAAVYTFRPGIYISCLTSAKDKVGIGMRKRGIW